MLLLLPSLVAACHVGDLLSTPAAPGDTPSEPPVDPPLPGSRQMALHGGNSQRDTISSTLDPYEVRLTDEDGQPAPGVTVAWRTLDGGSLDRAQSVTDASGVARAIYSLGTTPGIKRVQAEAPGYLGSPKVFSATADHGAVHSLAYEVDASDVPMGAAMAPAVRIVLRDRLGNLADRTTGSASVELEDGTGTPLSALTGTLSAPISSGRASFADLHVTLVGVGYRLRVSGAGRGAASGAFDVTLLGLP